METQIGNKATLFRGWRVYTRYIFSIGIPLGLLLSTLSLFLSDIYSSIIFIILFSITVAICISISILRYESSVVSIGFGLGFLFFLFNIFISAYYDFILETQAPSTADILLFLGYLSIFSACTFTAWISSYHIEKIELWGIISICTVIFIPIDAYIVYNLIKIGIWNFFITFLYILLDTILIPLLFVLLLLYRRGVIGRHYILLITGLVLFSMGHFLYAYNLVNKVYLVNMPVFFFIISSFFIFLGFTMVFTSKRTQEVKERKEKKLHVLYSLTPGLSHLIKETHSDDTYRTITQLPSPSLAITSHHPGKLNYKYHLEKTELIWLTKQKTTERAVDVSRMDDELNQVITKFINENTNSLVVIDCVEVLIIFNGFEKTARFLKKVYEVGAGKCCFIASINHACIEQTALTIIEKIFDRVIEGSRQKKVTTRFVLGGTYITESIDFSHLSEITRGARTLSFTFKNPLKIQYTGKNIEFVWLSESRSYANAVSPSKISVEGKQKIFNFLESHRGGIIIIDGIDALLPYNGFEDTFKFIKMVSDIVEISDATLLVTINPKAMGEREIENIEKLFNFKYESI